MDADMGEFRSERGFRRVKREFQLLSKMLIKIKDRARGSALDIQIVKTAVRQL